jgi:hypothetical protein
MTTLSNAITALVLTIPALAGADALPKPVTDMECLVGAWKATGTVTIGADKAKVDATWDCKRTSAKFGVMCNLKLTGIPGLPVYAETDLFGYEPNSNTYHWFAVTNAGETHDHAAKVPDANKIQFVYAGTQEAKPFKEVIDMDFGKDGKSFTLRAETFVANASTSVFDLKAKK